MKMKKKKWTLLLLALLVWNTGSSTVYAQTQNKESEEKDACLAPYFILHDADSSVDRFPLKETNVITNINGVIAETYVTQVYANEGVNPINASYVFPASSSVAVHGMTMEIGNQRVTAQIKEKEEARQEFEEAKSEGKSASLLEQQRPNVFTMDVANIMPGDTARIELHYTEMINPTEGIYEFVFPTVTGPRCAAPSNASNAENDSWIETPYLPDGNIPPGKYNITVNLSTGVPITDLTCKSHDVQISKKGDSIASVTLANPSDYAGNRDFILKYKLTGETLQSGLVLTRGKSENYFMLTVQPPERYISEDIPPREYIFVLDVSGSMYGYPLDTAKMLIYDLVTGLKETDKFNVILFSGSSIQMSPESLPATKENIEDAIRLIDQEEGGGWTSLAPALENALAIPMDEAIARSIVVITDGYISGEQNVFDIINENMDKASFFSFGIGCSVNDYLISGIAKAGLGESFIVTDAEDASSTAERFRSYIQAPLLTDIHISYEGFEVYDVEPAVPSTLFASRPIVLFGKWQGEADGIIQVSGKTGNQDYEQKIQVSDAKAAEQNEAVCYLWARTRLERLMDYGYSKDDPSVKEEVTQIGLAYNIMTPYTSFIAVIDEIRNPGMESTDVDQPLPLPLKVSNLAVGGGYRAYSEPGNTFLIFIVAAMAAIYLASHIRKKENLK